MPSDEPLYGPEELAEQAGVSRRTVRYYVQRGLLPAPRGLGRGKHYGKAHLERLRQIRALQEAGEPLERIAERLDGPVRTPGAPEPRPVLPVQTGWSRVVLADGVELHLRGRTLDAQQLRALAVFVTHNLGVEQP